MIECKHCHNSDPHGMVLIPKGSQTGLYCRNCSRWLKWVGKSEVRSLIATGVTVGDSDNTTQTQQITCPVCSSTQFTTRQSGIHIGLYCCNCGRWIKWIKRSKAH